MLLPFLFWFCVFVLFYSYIGYGVLLGLRSLVKKKRINFTHNFPGITLVIAGYNEAVVLPRKISNTFAIDYPKEKLKIIFVSDGSTDETASIIRQYPEIQLIEKPIREGKAAALNTAMQYVQTPFVVFSDANGMLNGLAMQEVMRHFADEQVGGVAGEKKIIPHSGMAEAEGLYWKYESVMKQLDAQFYSVLSATGELFAMRTHLYQPLDNDIILDDLVISLNIALQGFRIAYEPRAFSSELSMNTIREEEERKVRIAAGAFQALNRLSWKRLSANARLLFQFISRRWLRWVLCPFILIVLFFLNIILVNESRLYLLLLAFQVLFYFLALAGYACMKQKKQPAMTAIPFYFLFMNYCMIKGLIRFKKNKQTVLWHKAERHA